MVECSDSPYNAPLGLVIRTRDIRLCFDYGKLTEKTTTNFLFLSLMKCLIS